MTFSAIRSTPFARCVALLFVLPSAAAIAGGAFSETGSLVSPRALHGSAVMGDGRVLMVGGLADFGVVLDSSEVYDPATGTFTAAGSITDACGGPTTVTLADGRVLVAGGRGGTKGDTIFDTAEIFDPATDAFAPTGSMTTPRYVASGTLLDDGTVLIAGGFQGRDVLDTAEIYDPATGAFTATGSLGGPRVAPVGAVKLADGRVLIVGGSNDSGPLATAEIYDPATGTFAPTGSLPEPRLDPALVLLGDGRVLAAGGSDGNNNYAATAMLFDPATGTFTPTADLNFPRDGHTGTKLADGRVLIAGGSHLGGADPYVATAEIYDPATGTFAIAGDIPEPRYAATASALADGRVLIAGGWAGPDSRPTASAVLFTPELGDEIFGDGFDPPPEVSISNYDDLVEGFLGESYAYNGVSYHDVNGIGGVFPDGSTFTPEDVGNQLIVEDSTVFYADFPDFGSPPNTLTFGTSFVPGENLTIGALVRVTMDLDTPMSEATVDLGYYENGPWGGIVIHLDALDGDTVVASDELTIANGGDRDNPTTARFTVSASSFTSLKLYSTYEDQPSAPRIMIDDLTLTPATSAQP